MAKDQIELRKIDAQTYYVTVSDTDFAVALMSIGFRPMSPSVTVREDASGKQTAWWNLEPMDLEKKIPLGPLLKAQKDPVRWIAQNQEHILAPVLAYVINRKAIGESLAQKRPFVTFDLGPKGHVHVLKDSRRHRALVDMGAKQI